MGTITIKQTDDASNSYSDSGVEWDEFIPFVDLRNPKGYNTANHELPLEKDVNDDYVYVDLLGQTKSNKKTKTITTLPTELKKSVLPFKVERAGDDSYFEDEDGYIAVELSLEKDKFVKVEGATAKIKLKSDTEFGDKVLTKFGDTLEVEIDITAEKSLEFYIRFLANDDEDTFKGEYENLFCGCMKVFSIKPNEWQFSEEKIKEIRRYAMTNNSKYNGRGDANRYHHCTDTHKHIVYKLLDNPSGLLLGKDQNHEAVRMTPKDFEKAGESTTNGVRSTLITKTYAESSKTFTVIDIKGNEVLGSNGKAGNTNNELKSFKESPVEYMKDKCPDNGFYIFIGAYNDDYHSFTILVNKKEDNFSFEFIDQMVGSESFKENNLEELKLLYDIYAYASNYPMKLELYQLRNKMK